MTPEYQQLLYRIHEVRHRFKWIVFARGLAFSLALSLAILVVAVLLVDHWNYSDRALMLARVLSILSILATFAWFLGRPLLRKVEDVQIARYVEERHPVLQDRLVTAIELGKESAGNPIVPLLVRDALGHSKPIQARSLFNPREPFLSGAIAFGLIVFFVLLQVFGPDFVNYATLKLYSSWLIPQTESLYRLDITPRNIQVKKGSDQLISARLIGFDSQEVSLFSRYQGRELWERSRMEPAKASNAFGFLFLDIHEKVRYYVQAGNVKSPEFSISVTDVAQVEKIDLSYHFPRYTGLPTKREEDAGEIAALKGTQVDVEAVTNVDVAAARILFEDGTSAPMQKIAEKRFQGRIDVRKNSAYKIELTDFSKVASSGSHQYPITALDDQSPTVTFLKPGRDKRATKLEEVLSEVKADDDFGVNSLKLHFTVNGGMENVVDLFQQKAGAAPKSISGTHTFFLEEYNLEPGDFISYFAKASDARNTTTSDIYFLEIRPFGKEFSQAQAAGMGGGQADVGSVLSARQKEILAATWRLIRDKKSFSPKEYVENVKVVANSQSKLQQQTKTLSDRIQRRALATRDKEFEKLSENLIKAVEAMTPARELLSQDKTQEAVSPEQTSLQYLMRAEAYFKEIQVAYGNSSSGQSNSLGAEELEGLFELELDKLKNQYETLQQGNSMQAGDEIDEAARKLKELARRQQQLNERQHQLPQSRFSQGGSSGGSEQQALQAEIEKLARQLERLSRETQNEELLKASQRLKQAAQEMGNTSKSGGSESQNRGLQALSRMNHAQQLLDSQQRNSLSDELKRMQSNAEQLGQQEEKIQSELGELARSSMGKAPDPSSPANLGEQTEKNFSKKRQIFQDKSQLKKGLDVMEQSLFSSAKRSASQQKSTSQKLQSAGNSIRENRIQEKVDHASQLIAYGLLDGAKQREQDIQAAIEGLKQKIASAEKSLVNSNAAPTREEKLSRALSQTGDLIGSLESLNRRLQQFQGSKPQPGGQRSNQPAAGERQKDAELGQQSPDSRSGDSNKASDQDSEGKEGQNGSPGGGQSSKGQNQQDSSQTARTDGNSKASTLGGSSPKGQPWQAAGDDTEHQYYGSTNLGNAAVNFGDRDLPAPGSLTPEQKRQFEKEYELRLKEAQEIRKHLADQPDLADQIKNVVERMKQMGSLKFLQDEKGLERLRSSVIEGFRQLEVNLSKSLQQQLTKENLHLAKDEDIPEPYRKQVEDYYKALSKR